MTGVNDDKLLNQKPCSTPSVECTKSNAERAEAVERWRAKSSGAVESACPECYLIGTGGLVKAAAGVVTTRLALTELKASESLGEITADEIRAINRSLGGTTELTGSAETVIANMAYREGVQAQAATAIRDIAGRHLFDDANKRTAQAVAERLLGPGANTGKIRSVIDRVGTGDLRSVEDIARAIGH